MSAQCDPSAGLQNPTIVSLEEMPVQGAENAEPTSQDPAGSTWLAGGSLRSTPGAHDALATAERLCHGRLNPGRHFVFTPLSVDHHDPIRVAARFGQKALAHAP